MKQPVAPAKPARPAGYVSQSVYFWVLFLGLIGLAWLRHSTGFLSVFWYVVAAAAVSITIAVWRASRFDDTPEGEAYEAAKDRYHAAYAQYQHDLSVWQAEQYRAQLQLEAMNDWARMTGGQYRPTVEWVVNRMKEIEQEREQRAFQQRQIQLQQAEVALTAAMVWEQSRTRHAIQAQTTAQMRQAQPSALRSGMDSYSNRDPRRLL